MYPYLILFAAIAVAALFAAPKRHKVWVAAAIVVLLSAAAAAVAVEALCGRQEVVLAEFATAMFGAERLAVDRLSALFLLIIAVASVATVIYSKGYVEHYLERSSSAHIALHYTSLVTLVGSMMTVVMSSGGFSFLMSWELMTIASFLLILFEAERREVRRAALNYLVMMHIGFIFLVIGFVAVYSATGLASFGALSDYFSRHAPLPVVVVFIVGFGMKAGMFPMHVWLPEAHPAAPSHVSAIMSGVMIKTGIYGILRVAAEIESAQTLYVVGIIILFAGIVTGVWGVILAAVENDMKRLLAYSSIENIGVILIGMGIAYIGRAADNDLVAMCGMCGALLHAVNHSLFKTLLFFGSGNIYSNMHSTSLDKMGGLARHMPVTALLMIVATVAICALPPLNGFVSELLIYLGMFNGVGEGREVLYSVAAIVALSLIGGVVVLAFTKLYGIVFLGSPRSTHVAETSEVDNCRIAAMALPAAMILAIGLLPQYAVRPVVEVAADIIGGDYAIAMAHFTPVLSTLSAIGISLLAVVALLYILKRRAQAGRTVSSSPTWGCGFTALNTRMQYTGESYSEGLENIATSLTQNRVDGRTIDKSEIFPSQHRYDVSHKDKIDRLFAAWWVEAMHRINVGVMRLRTGKINHYIMYALALLAAVMVLTLLNLL
ncbi:MAG: NADH-quinone oxidoreductase subunit E [Alistipes sp.]|nr:NADH-quinone oxidoreductase subunit E [Alistipes sp.]